MIRRALILVASLLPFSSAGAAKPPAWQAPLERELKAVMDDHDHPIPSLAVAALRKGEIVYAAGFGSRSFDRHGGPVGADTLFRVASVSKAIVAVGVMRLVEQKKLDLEGDASRYLGWPLRNPDHPDAPITLRMVMSHTSSLRDDGGYSFPADWRLESVLRPGGAHFGEGRQWAAAAPGRSFVYTNLNWGVLGSMVERTSRQRFDRYMAKEVLGPLHISGGFNPSEFNAAELANLATLYRKQNAEEAWDRHGAWIPQGPDRTGQRPAKPVGPRYQPGANGTLFSPQGGLRISARGLALFAQGLYRNRLLKHPTAEIMLADGGNARGLGFERFAGMPGGATTLVEDPEFRAVGVLGNAYGGRAGFAIDLATGNGLVFVIGGVGVEPESYPGSYSSLTRWEEKVLTALWRHAVKEQKE